MKNLLKLTAMKNLAVLFSILFLVSFSSCNKGKIKDLENQLMLKDQELIQIKEEADYLKKVNGSLLDRMEDLSIVSKAGAESIQYSLESLSDQYDFIQDLTTKVHSKDSLNLALVMNLKRSLLDINDEDVQIEVRGGMVHVSISDKLLFRSGSSKISASANDVLGKIASVLNDHNELDVIVEGHTDNVPITNSCIVDNWDLSAKRATSVVRVLETEHYVDPQRLTAAGRSEYIPKADNESSSGRSLNRRTEIIITPKMDQFFKLLESPALKK
jgi:chemotaxis protein MotB